MCVSFMRKVLTVGVFDYFHYGHLKLFANARRHGEYLIVAIQHEDYILKYKPGCNLLYSTQQRIEMVSSLSIVDEVIIYSDVDTIVKNVDFDIFVVGEDQNHSGFLRAIDWCNKNGKEVRMLKRTQGISSTEIKDRLN